jgi:hypothetical protein
MSLSHEVPARLRRLPAGRIAVRLTETAASALCMNHTDAGWRTWRADFGRRVATFCRSHCGPTPRTQRDSCPYTPAEKTAMRRLAEQIEARLAP